MQSTRRTVAGALLILASGFMPAHAAVIEDNEFDGIEAYGVMLKTSADTVIRKNRIHNSGYGLAFVLGNQRTRSPDLNKRPAASELKRLATNFWRVNASSLR